MYSIDHLFNINNNTNSEISEINNLKTQNKYLIEELEELRIIKDNSCKNLNTEYNLKVSNLEIEQKKEINDIKKK
jgi:hypothetical protein